MRYKSFPFPLCFKDELGKLPHDALTAAESLLANTPDFYRALDSKALALAGLGEFAEARAVYQVARAVNSHPGAVWRAMRLLEQLGDIPKFWMEWADSAETGTASPDLGQAQQPA